MRDKLSLLLMMSVLASLAGIEALLGMVSQKKTPTGLETEPLYSLDDLDREPVEMIEERSSQIEQGEGKRSCGGTRAM